MAPRRVLPFSLCQKPVLLLGQLRELSHILLGVAPADVDHGHPATVRPQKAPPARAFRFVTPIATPLPCWPAEMGSFRPLSRLTPTTVHHRLRLLAFPMRT